MWFTDAGPEVTPHTPAIGRIDPSTGEVTEFTEPTGMNAGSNPFGMGVGPDGNLWFTDTGTTKAIGEFGVGAQAASVAQPVVARSGQAGTQQECEGELWANWAGQQPSLVANGFDGYQWLLNGTPIGGATAESYAPTNANVGGGLSCRVTATYTLFPTTVWVTSAAVTVIVQMGRTSRSHRSHRRYGSNRSYGSNRPHRGDRRRLEQPGGPVPQGHAGKVELVTCTTVRGKKVCTTKLVAGPVTFTTASAQGGDAVTRQPRVRDWRRQAHRGRAQLGLTLHRRLTAGRYELKLGPSLRETVTVL